MEDRDKKGDKTAQKDISGAPLVPQGWLLLNPAFVRHANAFGLAWPNKIQPTEGSVALVDPNLAQL